MADYIAQESISFFRVKDRVAFEAFARENGFGVLQKGGGLLSLKLSEDDDRGIFAVSDGDDDDDESEAFRRTLAGHLADGEVAVLRHIGHIRNSLDAYAVAFRSDGVEAWVQLDDVFELAASRLGASAEGLRRLAGC